jgi:hypothetical protein
MTKNNQRWAALTTWILANFLLLNYVDWPNLKFWGLRGGLFIDSSAIQYYAKCFNNFGYMVYEAGTLMDCKQFVYGTFLLRIFNLIGITYISELSLGVALLILLSITMGSILSKTRLTLPKLFMISTFLAVSPPISLLAERGNLDIVIFAIVWGSFVSTREKQWFQRIILISIASMMKFYTLPLLLILFIALSRRQKILSFPILVAVFSYSVMDFLHIQSLPEPSGAAFGNLSFYYYLRGADLNLPIGLGYILGLALVIVMCIFFSRLHNFGYKLTSQTKSNTEFIAASTLIACYFFGMNYDYRLIFALIPIHFAFANIGRTQSFFKLILIYTFIFWGSFNLFQFQFIGDLFIGVFISFYIFAFCNSDNFHRFFQKIKANKAIRNPK